MSRDGLGALWRTLDELKARVSALEVTNEQLENRVIELETDILGRLIEEEYDDGNHH